MWTWLIRLVQGLVIALVCAYAQQWVRLPAPEPDPADIAAWQETVTAFAKKNPAPGYLLAPLPKQVMEKILAQPSTQWGKRQWVEFLKERYGYSVERVNEAYGMEAASFSDVLIANWRLAKRNAQEEEEFLRALEKDLLRVAEPIVGKGKVKLLPAP